MEEGSRLTVVDNSSTHCPSYESEQDEETEQDGVSPLDVSIDRHDIEA